MKAIAWFADVDQDDDLELRRWLLAGLAVLAIQPASLSTCQTELRLDEATDPLRIIGIVQTGILELFNAA